MADEKLIFPIGFDLEEGVAQVEKDWGKMQKKLQDTFKSQTIQVDADISKAVLDKLYAKFEGLIKTMESKAPQIKLKIPDTVDFEQEINRLKVQLKSINLGELTDAESKDLYLYIRQLEALAKALKEVNKQEQLRQANNPANKALQEARAQEKLTRAKANDALAEQRRAKIATETARQNEINNRSAQRGAVIAEQKRAATARAEQAELRLTQAKQRSTDATERQNAAYKTQSGYLQRLFQRMIAYASVAQAMSFLRNIKDVTAEFELQRVALGSIIGDLNEANAMFEQIKAAAVKSPFQIKELVTYTKQLAAYKIETDELFETTQRLADVSAGLGVGMERLVLAYGQIRATGYLRASEVRQLTEAGIPIVEELAKKMSQLRGETVSAAEVMGMISERAISFGMVKEVFDDMTSAGGTFYKMQEKQAETLSGQWSNLQDSISIMYEEIGNTEGVNNAMKGMIGLVKSLAENWKGIGTVLVSIGVSYGVLKVASSILNLLYVNTTRYAVATRNLQRGIYDLRMAQRAGNTVSMLSAKWQIALASAQRGAATATTTHARAWNKLKYAIMSNPIGLILTAISTLVSLLVMSNDELEDFNEELAKIGTEGALQADQSVRNFERLAKTIRESADGSEKQTEALKELKRSYGDLLPEQDKEIKALVQEKSNYDELIKSIRRKIELQIQEQKLSKIISEYSDRIDKKEDNLTDWLTGKDWRSVEKFTEQQASDITFAIRQAVSEGLITAEDDWKTVAGKLTKIINETTLKKSWFGVDTMYGVNRDMYEEYVNVILDMYRQIDKVGGALDKMDDKGKNLADTFNTWQKELEAINEGTNDLGDNIRIFDDTTISQITKITDATSRVADEYKRLAKEKERVDKVLLSEGAKADSKTYAQLEKRLGRINTAMSMLYNFLEKYGGLDLLEEGRSGGGKKTNPRIALLNEELSTVEKIYKEYQELRKFMSDDDARTRIADMFEGVNLTMLSQALSPTEMRTQLQKALDEAKKMGDKKQILELEYKLGKFDADEARRQLEKSVKDLSDKISRTKTAKEFFDRMLGMTGDKELSATLTLSVYGTTGDDIKSALVKQVQGAFAGQDLSKAINTDLNSIDLSALREIYNNLPEDVGEKQKQSMKQVLDMLEKGQNDLANNFAKLLMDYDEMEQKRVTITQKATQEIATLEQGLQAQIEGILENKEIIDKNSAIAQAKARAEAVRKAILAREKLELSKLSPEYIRFFSSINAMAMETANSTRTQLRRALFEAFEQGGISAEELRKELKAIDTQFNKLNENASIFASYITGGFDSMIAKLRESADELDAIAARMKKLKSLDEMDEGDTNFVNKMLNVFGGEGQKSLSDLAASFNGDMSKMGEAVQQVGGEMQGVFSSAAGAISIVDMIIRAVHQSVEAIKQVIDQINSMRSEDNQIGGWFDYISDFDKYAFSGWERLKSGDVMGAMADTASSIISIFQNIQSDKIERIDKSIEELELTLDNLSYAYGRLQKAQEEVFGSEYINNYQRQLENLESQQEAYLKQAELERSKGKKADEDKIREYEEQARDTADAIKDMYGSLSEHFLGQDLASAARDFASAWIDAYKSFSNTTDAMKDKFEEMIQNMLVESIIARVMERALKPVFDMVDNMQDSDFYSNSFWAQLSSQMDKAAENGAIGAENIMSMIESMGINLRDTGASLTGISKDIATASEESILGLAAGINTQNFYISQVPTKLDTIIGLLRGGSQVVQGGVNMQDLITIQNQHLSYLPTIAQHTSETVAECKAIVVETRRTADALERVVKPRGTQSTHSVNVTIGS